MCFHWNKNNSHPSPLLRGIQIVLLVLIIIGLALLLTQDLWVPTFVEYLLAHGW